MGNLLYRKDTARRRSLLYGSALIVIARIYAIGMKLSLFGLLDKLVFTVLLAYLISKIVSSAQKLQVSYVTVVKWQT